MLYLIDYENTGPKGLSGCEALTKKDKIVVFHSNEQENMIEKMKTTLPKTRSKIMYLEVSTGRKNALDFQLSSYLGALIYTDQEKSFCIVSKDRGYEVLQQFWKTEANVFFAESIAKQVGINMKGSLTKIYGKETAKTVMKIMDLSDSKSALHGRLCYEFGSDTGHDIYSKVKLYTC